LDDIDIRKVIKDEVDKQMGLFYEEQRRLQSLLSFEASESSTPVSTSSKLSCQSPSTHPFSAKIIKLNELVAKNLRHNLHWENKKLEDVFPILNDDSRLMNAIIQAEAEFISEIRY
jgi:hypothetical protein